VLCLGLLLAACGASGGQSGTDESGVGRTTPSDPSLPSREVGPACETGPTVFANEVNGYTLESSLSLTVDHVAPDPAALTFGWGNVTADFAGRSLDPLVDIDSLQVVLWRLGVIELEQKLNNGSLGTPDAVALGVLETDGSTTECSYYDVGAPGGGSFPQDEMDRRMDPQSYPPDQYTFTLMAATGTAPGSGTRMLKAFRVAAGAENHHVEVGADSTLLSVSADLRSLTPMRLPVRSADITFDWSELTVNALGNEFVAANITEIAVANYAETPAELESAFVDLETSHGGMWRAEVTKSRARLDALVDEEGDPFPGFDDDGTWVIALFCGSCLNPAPWYLSVVTPCTP
jgi:hypothetical protein